MGVDYFNCDWCEIVICDVDSTNERFEVSGYKSMEVCEDCGLKLRKILEPDWIFPICVQNLITEKTFVCENLKATQQFVAKYPANKYRFGVFSGNYSDEFKRSLKGSAKGMSYDNIIEAQSNSDYLHSFYVGWRGHKIVHDMIFLPGTNIPILPRAEPNLLSFEWTNDSQKVINEIKRYEKEH